MCTEIVNRLPRIALRPIKCYKVVLREDCNFYSPYQYKIIKLNTYQKAKGKVTFKNLLSRQLDKGVIHSFVFKYDAEYLQRSIQIKISPYLLYLSARSYCILECYIPRFTIYWKGIFNAMDTYCSKKIFFKEII